jgi:HSP20 family protein
MYFEFPAQLRQGATWSPIVDVSERANEVTIFVEMPGVQRSDVQLSWSDGVLIISGVKRQTPPGYGAAKHHCVERTYGQFRREITIDIPIDYKDAKAELKDGLMKIHLPKAKSQMVDIPIFG